MMSTVGFASKVSWSYTRSRLWNECRRKHFFNYYQRGEDNEDELRCLKSLTTHALVAGEVVHTAIHTYLRRLKEEGEAMSDLVDWAKKRFDAVARKSFKTVGRLKGDYKAYKWGDQPFHNHWYVYEVNGQPKIAYYVIQNSLETFLGGTVLDTLLEVGAENWWLAKTQPDDFPPEFEMPGANFTYFASYDLGVVVDDRLVFVDWKTGLQTEESVSAADKQLATYALSSDEYGFTSENTDVQAVFLKNSGDWLPEAARQQLMLKVRDQAILENAQELALVEEVDGPKGYPVYLASADDFQENPEPKRCFYCNYRDVCHLGAQAAAQYGRTDSTEEGEEDTS